MTDSPSYIELRLHVSAQFDARSYAAGVLSVPRERPWPVSPETNRWALVVTHEVEPTRRFTTWADVADWLAAVTDSPDTPTVPDELVQAVYDALDDSGVWISRVQNPDRIRAVLDAVPDGYYKLDGRWRRLTDPESDLLRRNADAHN